MKKAPCKDCENRKIGCHSRCELYLEYKGEREMLYIQRIRKVDELTPNISTQRFMYRKQRRVQSGH